MKSYIEDQLNSNEELLYVCRKHWMSLLPALIAALAAVVLLFNTSRLSALVSEYPVAVRVVELTVYIIALVLFWRTAKDVLIFLTTELAFTDRRLIGKVGIIRTRSLLTPLDKINHISATNGLFGRFLGFGNVLVHTSSGQITYEQIVNHAVFIKALMDQIAVWHQESAVGREPGPRPAPVPETSPVPDAGVPQSSRSARRQEPAAASPPPPAAAPSQVPPRAPAPALAKDPRTPPAPSPVPAPASAPRPQTAPASAPSVPGPAPPSAAGEEADPSEPTLIGRCVSCQAQFSYQPSSAGKSFRCYKCGAPLTVPSKSSDV